MGYKISYDKELDFENDLIKMLVEDKGWKDGVLNYPTEDDLINNWANIIYKRNQQIDRLGNYPLTKGEMNQVLTEVSMRRTPLKLNGFINDGIVQIVRDEERDTHNFKKTVSLDIFHRREIAAGRTFYQIARQPRYKAKDNIYPNRRGDFCLLINGMPLIHVELKKSCVPVSEAQYQIQKYLNEGVFTGIFSLVQIFVAMNPEECTYFANPGSADKFNQNFCFHWADSNNDPVNAWQDIAGDLISIPMAHYMIGYYTVADNTDNTLKVMRSYQVNAASAISDRVTKMQWGEESIYGGYVWQTTGSGKTLTSFKSAQLISNSKDADKVVFLMDRIELGTQSLREYRGFADDTEEVQATESTDVLISKLKSSNTSDTLIVTSIQKMSRIKQEEGVNTHDIDMINKKRIVFIIDECHRSVFGEMLSTIKFTFPGAIFFGFSGTPILDINKKKDSTTADVFGNELETARYTIADGMRDGNVLGFDSIPQPTYKDKDLREIIALDKSNSDSVEAAMADENRKKIYLHWMEDVPMGEELDDEGKPLESIEGEFSEALYNCDKHRNAVIDDILDNWSSQSLGGKYHAILACSRIPDAIAYYKLFKARDCGLNITAVFDPSDGNNEYSIDKIEGIHEILEDYGRMYGTEYGVSNYAAFKKDVCARLAHKEPYIAVENDKNKCLNILIVVDQMLTGYDSKWLNTLYMDKTYRWSNIEMIIQAFSRTNRVFHNDKKHGIIRYYRRPYTMKNIIEYAFKSYSGDKPYGIFVLKLKRNLQHMNEAFSDIKDVFVLAGIPDFQTLPDDKDEIKKFANLFKKLNGYLESARVQGFVWEKSEYEFDDGNVVMLFDKVIYDTLLVRYKEIRRGGTGGGSEVGYDIDPYLMSLPTDKIDSDYMNSRFHKYYKMVKEGADEETKNAMLNELHKSFATLSQAEQKYAHMVIHDIQNGSLDFDDSKTIIDYISSYLSKAKNDELSAFAARIGIPENALRSFMSLNVDANNIDEFGRFEKLKQTIDIETAQKYFEEQEGKPIPRRKIHPKIDKLLRDFILSKETEE
ncbi:type I restriction enzyme, R subunit [Clostridium neonatale]|uniref:type I restriction endonuclease subunit R, EcoR124 family n=1 Tax=Clostridium neonatale TaxID=137838 RepID=UPI00291B8335|nr:DEAD/DEAH box helicase family protein [Clostridium neonatale]CAI3677569.1 type I restriction enzyme, R subunit [Clostridium neonatale]